jgi:hypothetical protein
MSKLTEYNNYSDPLSALVNNMNYANLALSKPQASQAVTNILNSQSNHHQNFIKNVRNHFSSEKTNSAMELNHQKAGFDMQQSSAANQAMTDNANDTCSENGSSKIKSILKRSSSFDASTNVAAHPAASLAPRLGTRFATQSERPTAPSAVVGAGGPRDSIELTNVRLNSANARLGSGDGRKKSVRFATQFMTAENDPADPFDDDNESAERQTVGFKQPNSATDPNCKFNFIVINKKLYCWI